MELKRYLPFFVIFLSFFQSNNLGINSHFTQSKSLTVLPADTSSNSSLKNIEPPCTYTPSLWLKADQGISLNGTRVSAWDDQSTNANHANQVNNNLRPIFQDNGINFNPSINFDGSNDFLTGAAGGSNTTLFMVAHSDIVISRNSPGQTIITTDAQNPTSNSYFFTLGSITAAFTNEVITHGIGSSVEYRKALTGNITLPNTPHLYSTDHIQTTMDAAIYYDGTKIDNSTANTFINSEANRAYRIGGNVYAFGGFYFNGQIAEVLSFPGNLTTNNRNIIQSYLGIKYGISLSHAYQNSNGVTLWNEPNYMNNIGAIGRDDCFTLNQKQTKNTQAGAILTVGLGNIAATNTSNANSFATNQSYLFWGHDNDNNGIIEENSTELPVGIDKRLDREWKIRNINTVAATTLQFDLNGITHSAMSTSDLFLLIDTDGDGNFTTGMVQKIPATAYNSGLVTFSGIDLQDGVVISLATMPTANTAPILVASSNLIEACPNGQNTLLATEISVTDIDGDNLTAQLSLTGISDNMDVLGVNLAGFPTANQAFTYPVLQITGIINPTQMEAILQTLFFSTTSNLAGTRTISLVLNDNIDNSNTINKQVQADENLDLCCSAKAPLISR